MEKYKSFTTNFRVMPGDSDIDDIDVDVDTDIDRRKVLSAATGAVGSAGLASAVASAEDTELTAAEVEEGLAEAEIIPTSDPRDGVTADDVEPTREDIRPGADIYVGKYKNADVPGRSAYEVQSYEEWLRQEAPTGFERRFSTNISDLLYVQQDIGSVTIEGYTFNLGVGVGLTVSAAGGTSLSGTLSLDIYVNGASFAITSFSVGYGRDGLCVGAPIKYGPLPGLEVDVCIDFAITTGNGDICLEASLSVSPCIDPCPVISCAYCKSLSSPPIDYCVDNPF